MKILSALMLGTVLLVSPASHVRAAHSFSRTGAQAKSRASTRARCPHRNPASGTVTVADAPLGPPIQPALTDFPEVVLEDDLFRYDSKGHLYPMMATQIPSLHNGGIRNGGRIMEVHLKPGLRWSNGTEITSADIKFGWQVDSDPLSGPGGPACTGSCDVVKSIDTPNRYTAVFHLRQVAPSFVSPNVDFGGNMARVWPKHGLAWKGDPHLAATKLFQDPSYNILSPGYLTDGPFKAVSLKQDRLTLQPMKYYDDMTCGAFVRKLVLTTYNTGNFGSSTAQAQAAISGKIDVGLDYFPVDARNLTHHRGRYELNIAPTFTFEHLLFNLDKTFQSKANPLSNTKVRLALALALDKTSIIRSALSLDTKQAKDIQAWTPWIHTPHLVQPYTNLKVTGQWDPLANGGKGGYLSSTGNGAALTDARKLLASTPWKHGFRLEMYTDLRPERLVSMPLVAKAWNKLGVTVVQHSVTIDQLFSPWEGGGLGPHGAFQVLLFAEAGAPNPDTLYTLMQSRYIDRDHTAHSPDKQNYAGIRDSLIDRSFSQAIHTFNQSSRKRDFWAIQQRLNQRAYWIPLYYRANISSSANRVVGFKPNPIIAMDGWNSYDWRVK